MARFRVVTRHQISGWRFLLRRLEHALVRRDASMLDDPGRGRSTALTIGFALACVVLAGAAVLAFFKPAKVVGSARIVADKDSGAVYVRIDDRLHPALNLTSARLIAGSPDKPVQVSREELAKYPRGPWVGIPGAPGNLVDDPDRNSSWAVCDSAQIGATAPLDPRTGLPTLARSTLRTTVIGAPLVADSATTRPLTGAHARLVRGDDTVWLLYPDPETGSGVVRAALTLADTAVMLALGLDSTAPVLPISAGLLRAIPEVPALRVPEIPDLGQSVTLGGGYAVTVGSVLTVPATHGDPTFYLVSNSGVVKVSSVLAAMIRNTDTGAGATTRTVAPSIIAAALRPGGWPGTAKFPTRPAELIDETTNPVTCYHWTRKPGENTATTGMLVGTRLPLSDTERARTVSLVTAPGSHGRTADAAYLPRTTGQFIQVTGTEPDSPRRESLFWISDSGVRYGIATDSNSDTTLRALALRQPVLAPWSIVSLFAVGPTLSQQHALLQHDGIPANPGAAGLGGGR
ncbi:type VII secretion protein EccB [Nocardia sp. 2]|uniref:Type VII secretion protein EccB n=1 Tax=Nocardia acididurans TaxID=2802282 RepID=A0ABS1MGI8_9NOCA|nr:type VII secretion protein EccB [Nocardia acididurans]MBL1079773.1 type VII secretion protein EccB [Nocardia acididurans]